MSLKLIPPRGERKNYTVRGTINGVRYEKSTRTPNREKAKAFLKKLQAEHDADQLTLPSDPVFAQALAVYSADTGQKRFLVPLLEHLGRKPIKHITQAVLDDTAEKLYPDATPATRNRQVYSPVIAILRHAGFPANFRRPRGAQGNLRLIWLWPEQFEKLHEQARRIDSELSLLFLFLVSTGARLSEALNMKCQDVRIDENFAFCGKTKNGDPRAMHLPAVLVSGLKDHPRGLKRDGRVFRWTKCGKLYELGHKAYAEAKIDDGGAPFHVLRHTYASWMRRYANADDKILLDTGAWKSQKSVDRYRHTVVSESARLSESLPLPGAQKPVPNPSPIERQISANQTAVQREDDDWVVVIS